MPRLVDAVATRMKKPGGDTTHAWLLLAYLYQQQVRGPLRRPGQGGGRGGMAEG